jgi:DNA polymerase III subunit delta
MNKIVPTVYLLHGNDEFSIKRAIGELQAKIQFEAGGWADMNSITLDGRTCTLDELRSATFVMPFLASRRLVILNEPISRFRRIDRDDENTQETTRVKIAPVGKKERDGFLVLLESLPASTALVLAEFSLLDDTQLSQRVKKDHWLISWAKSHPDQVYHRAFSLPQGAALVRWIQGRAQELGGRLTSDAAEELASLVGSDPRSLENELQKLLAYTNYQREVLLEDVATLTADTAETSIFHLVDALAERRGRDAIRLLNRILAEDDPARIFGMVIRQFRLLLVTRAVIENGGGEAEILQTPFVNKAFVARNLIQQARRFSTPDLQAIYHRLLEIDQAVKTSQLDLPLGLNTLVAATTN